MVLSSYPLILLVRNHFFNALPTNSNSAFVAGSSGLPMSALILLWFVSLPPKTVTGIPASFNTLPSRLACALGLMGRHEARPLLLRLLREPSAAIIDAVSGVADEECLVVIGRIARTEPDLADAALAALEAIASARAMTIAATARRLRPV